MILSQDITDIQASKRLADEKLQGLQTENTSLKAVLLKANNKYDTFTNPVNIYRYLIYIHHHFGTAYAYFRKMYKLKIEK